MFALSLVLLLLLNLAALVRADEIHENYTAYNAAEFGIFPNNVFKSVNARTPQLQVNIWNRTAMSLRGSHIFLRHDGHNSGVASPPRDSGPLILRTDDLSAVYINRTFDACFNVRVQEDRGSAYLTFYGGPMSGIGLGDGYAHAFDQTYRETYLVAAQKLRVKADIHEFEMTGHGTALVTAYELVPWDLSAFLGGTLPFRRVYIKDSIFQEIDLDTNEVLFQWRASEHINMGDSYQPVGNGRWDFFHINSIQKSKAGNYLISARHMHAVYLISGTTGQILWTLGGKANDFLELPYPEGKNFTSPFLTMAWQHHAVFYPGTDEKEMTIFDNHVIDSDLKVTGYTDCVPGLCSRGIHIRLDADGEQKTVQLLQEYLHPSGLASVSQGSVQVLDNGNVFVGWGRNPSFTEHTPDGTCVFDVQFGPWRIWPDRDQGLDNYRAFRLDWMGAPYWPPDIAARRGEEHDDVDVWVSWNGATEVRRWALLGSSSPDDLNGADKIMQIVEREGFETQFWVPLMPEDITHVRAAALNEAGDVIGSTGIVELKSGNVLVAAYPVTEVETSEEPEEEQEQEEAEGEKTEVPEGTLSVSPEEEASSDWSIIILRLVGFCLGIWLLKSIF
ncbi:hypothetical protein M406DRAFT_263071 [Cryphonectria parasitica EP155]|uniref:ASST-domain-containing protein n=1 Tax=Cryphonectria parasitica (strain ATCC 38755 / EP155) TaxID=660469 RepID=A0A9P4XZF2_CRYP1|nr:uncharacterized protein M406DRAFT_263071 [Cryphonectria parasitica EP155]KAF3763600.1 hypothetical protein M406DRAFT_263071 [Cryphonectria parasitica EP155]